MKTKKKPAGKSLNPQDSLAAAILNMWEQQTPERPKNSAPGALAAATPPKESPPQDSEDEEAINDEGWGSERTQAYDSDFAEMMGGSPEAEDYEGGQACEEGAEEEEGQGDEEEQEDEGEEEDPEKESEPSPDSINVVKIYLTNANAPERSYLQGLVGASKRLLLEVRPAHTPEFRAIAEALQEEATLLLPGPFPELKAFLAARLQTLLQ